MANDLQKSQAYIPQANHSITRNALIFSILMIITQIIIAVMHGVYMRPEKGATTASGLTYALVSVQNGIPYLLALLVIPGFGLIFSYNKKLIWSGLGFTFFITAFVLEFYPLINTFWLKTQILKTSTTAFKDSDKTSIFNLTNFQTGGFYYNSIEGAFRCALAVVSAFSFIIGRAGPLEAWFVTVIGTIGYQLNRQVCIRVTRGNDNTGTMYIFLFGGAMGLATAIILKCRQKGQASTAMHKQYTGDSFSAAWGLLGTIIIAATLPYLALSYTAGASMAVNGFLPYTSVQCVIFSISAGIFGIVTVTCILNGRINARDLIYGAVAGGIAGGAPSFFTTNIVYALVVGYTAGLFQAIFQSIFERNYLKKNGPIATISIPLFLFQGLLGSAFAAGWKKITNQYSNGQALVPTGQNPIDLFFFGLISLGIGLACGILAGLFVLLVNRHESSNHFRDITYWYYKDGISTGQKEPEYGDQSEYYREGDQIKNVHAYL